MNNSNKLYSWYVSDLWVKDNRQKAKDIDFITEFAEREVCTEKYVKIFSNTINTKKEQC